MVPRWQIDCSFGVWSFNSEDVSDSAANRLKIITFFVSRAYLNALNLPHK